MGRLFYPIRVATAYSNTLPLQLI